jgi:hypothetical protein
MICSILIKTARLIRSEFKLPRVHKLKPDVPSSIIHIPGDSWRQGAWKPGLPGREIMSSCGNGQFAAIFHLYSCRGWDNITCRDALVRIVLEPRGLRAVYDGPWDTSLT